MTASPHAAEPALDVRALASHDLPALLALYAQLQPDDSPLPQQRARQLWQAICADPALLYCGGFVEGQLISACNAAIVPNLTRGGRPFAVIENVITDAAQRGRGYGRRVLLALVERCWERGCYKIMLMSGSAREAAHAFYEAVGFDRHGKQAFVMRRP